MNNSLFSTKIKHALNILIYLARQEKEETPKVTSKMIREAVKVSGPYIEQLIHPLVVGGLVKTRRGCYGGYSLRKAADTINIKDVLILFGLNSEKSGVEESSEAALEDIQMIAMSSAKLITIASLCDC